MHRETVLGLFCGGKIRLPSAANKRVGGGGGGGKSGRAAVSVYGKGQYSIVAVWNGGHGGARKGRLVDDR